MNCMKKTIFTLLIIFGLLFSIIALISAVGILLSLAERSNYGAGLLFADVEIFIALALIFLAMAIICFWTALKIRKSSSANN